MLKKKNQPNSSQSEPELEINQNWLEQNFDEGELSVDVYETDNKIIIKSTIAGVKPEDLKISLNQDMLTIKGKRDLDSKLQEEASSLYQECYWGAFSRSIILPAEIEENKIDAQLEEGVLTIMLKKVHKTNQIEVKVK